MNPRGTLYPFVTILMALALIAYFYVAAQPELIGFYRLPEHFFTQSWQWFLLACFIVTLIIELRIYRRRCKKQSRETARIKQQIEELLENKKQLQAKAHVFAGHADKLKLFISDKLIEYIEYDEKFLHFKSIASEVRHNGVISYDKVKTALTEQIALTDNDEQTKPLQSALESLAYLWDLLDLSTADNIALHIANQVCESEEMIFQSELNKDDPEPYPSQNVFHADSALDKSVERCFGVTLSETDYRHISVDNHPVVRLSIKSVDRLLGNENHIVLALENLISNAQYYTNKRNYKQDHASIAMRLDEEDGYARYRIYNRGPHIDSENARHIFQLGFSTRRKKGDHGKGLGLYFVDEIVKGYDGKLDFRNIDNQSEVVSLRFETSEGDIITDVIDLLIDSQKPQCRKSGIGQGSAALQWKLHGALRSIEITHRSDQKTHRTYVETLDNKEVIYDPSQPAYPRWLLEIEQDYQNTLLNFKPLDIGGVEFELRLPTLRARLNGDLLSPDEETIENQVSQIKKHFSDQESLKSS
ncbi:MAG: ATP-binding protein [Candidatus Thiodiazotropha sp.]